MTKTQRPASDRNTVQLIGGRWRGRRIRFPDGEGLRPTPSRVRETLFNWLMHDVQDAHVLDLFAGSGALAFEALSRGARHAALIDASSVVCRQLERELAAMHGADARVICGDALQFLARGTDTPCTLVFLDPPFHRDLLPAAMALLEQKGWLAPQAWIYVESERPPTATDVPAGWRLHRRQENGQVCSSLYRREAA